MDQIQREKVLEKLGKIKALAERGVGGEKETALRMYEELCRKYDISEDEAEAALAQLEKRWFSYSTQLEENLLLQIFYKVIGSGESYIYTGKYSRRKKRGCVCTALEAADRTDFRILPGGNEKGVGSVHDCFQTEKQPFPG